MISPPAPGDQDRLTVASYNVHRCIGIDRRLDPKRVAGVISEMSCDVVGLQEVDVSYHRKASLDQFKLLGDATGLNAISGPTLRNKDGYYGNALFTSHQVLDVRRIDLSVSGREPRGALDVDLQVRGRKLRVIVAHLGLGFFERRVQLKRLCEIFCSENNSIEIMLGDFNEWYPARAPLRRIHDHFGKPPSRRTFPSFMPLLSLDRIWVKPLNSIENVCTHATPLSRVASDHLPIKASLSLDYLEMMKNCLCV